MKLPNRELAKLADLQRQEELKRKLADPPAPLFKEVRELVLRKSKPDKEKQLRAIFEKQPFGELERLLTQKLLDVVKGVAKEELENENWVHLVARLSGQSYEEMRVAILEFLDADVFNLSAENCLSFLGPLVESWDIGLATYGMDIVLNHRVAPGHPKRFEFVEREPEPPFDEETGLKEFLDDVSLSGGATEEEIEYLRKLRFSGKRPTPSIITGSYKVSENHSIFEPVFRNNFCFAEILRQLRVPTCGWFAGRAVLLGDRRFSVWPMNYRLNGSLYAVMI